MIGFFIDGAQKVNKKHACKKAGAEHRQSHGRLIISYGTLIISHGALIKSHSTFIN